MGSIDSVDAPTGLQQFFERMHGMYHTGLEELFKRSVSLSTFPR